MPFFERLEGLEFAGPDVEPVDAGKAIVLRPDLAVDAGALRNDHVDLRRVDIFLALERPELERFSLWIELCNRGLIHVAEPQITLGIAAQAEQTGRETGLMFGYGKFREFAGARIEPAEILFAKG